MPTEAYRRRAAAAVAGVELTSDIEGVEFVEAVESVEMDGGIIIGKRVPTTT
jgi:hypothetical protein